MKKVLTTYCMIALLSACSSSGKKEELSESMSDSSGSSDCLDYSADTKNILGSVYFGYDKSHLDHLAKEALKTQVTQLKDKPASIRLEGNADMRGTEEYNMGLGERRANAVKKFLEAGGVPQDKIQVTSLGKEKATGTTPEGYAKDRRVDTVLLGN